MTGISISMHTEMHISWGAQIIMNQRQEGAKE